MLIRIAILLLITTIYALVRYTIYGPVSVVHIPIYLLNKSIALATVCCLLFVVVSLCKQAQQQVKFWGIASFHLASIHVVMSTTILSSDYFPAFFNNNQMNFMGELTVLFGILSGYALWFARHPKSTSVQPKVFQCIASVFILGHLFSIGYSVWFNIGRWHGGLPPISLISFIIVMTSLLLLIKHNRN